LKNKIYQQSRGGFKGREVLFPAMEWMGIAGASFCLTG